jgi:exopolysaccharide production protein ExoY
MFQDRPTLSENVASVASPLGEKELAEQALGGGLKRFFDILFAVSILPLVVLILLFCACWIKLASPGPVFFAHKRIGFRGQPFPCLKLRTMKVGAHDALSDVLANCPDAKAEFERTQKLKEDPRIIPGIGTFLRKSSLDELPQFLNVLIGQMSVVGPRPVTQPEFRQYGRLRASYRKTRPGITGLWQISGRNELSFDERVVIDGRYVKSWSFWRDLSIVRKTIAMVLSGRGAY